MKKIVLSFIALFAAVSVANAAYTIADGVATGVTTWDEVVALIANNDVATIQIANAITVPNGASVDFKGKTITVPVPYVDPTGAVPAEGYSKFNVLTIASGSTVVISNACLMGGFVSGGTSVGGGGETGGIKNNGFLTLSNVSITRTGTGILNTSSGIAILDNCDIIRCANQYGGGILNQGKMVLDMCSLTENRSLNGSGGGGAAENQGYLYINNSTIANNTSTEIGGAINNCCKSDALPAKLYIINSTLVGNVTVNSGKDESYGGAIGNNKGQVYAANCIFADNKCIYGTTIKDTDLGNYTTSGKIEMTGCIYGTVTGSNSSTYVKTKDCSTDTDGLFASYRSDGVISKEDDVTAAFEHPAVVSATSSSGEQLYVPLASDSAAISAAGYVTYFDYSALYTNKNAKIVMSYYTEDDPQNDVALGGDVTDAPFGLNPVGTTFDGENRVTVPTIGSAGATTETKRIYTVWASELQNGKMKGATIFGDSYFYGDSVTVTAIPDSGYYTAGWKFATTKAGLATAEILDDSIGFNTFEFGVTGDTWVQPVFKEVTTMILVGRQRYPWNNLVDIDYYINEDATEYRLVFFVEYMEDGVQKKAQLKTFRSNEDVTQVVKINSNKANRQVGWHRITWDAEADGVAVFSKKNVKYTMQACQGVER